jgi:hypothetical protein
MSARGITLVKTNLASPFNLVLTLLWLHEPRPLCILAARLLFEIFSSAAQSVVVLSEARTCLLTIAEKPATTVSGLDAPITRLDEHCKETD